MVKLPVHLIQRYALKICEEEEVLLHAVLTRELDGGKWSDHGFH
jgi:hypothetical protein